MVKSKKFRELIKAVKKQYLGKPVPKLYQKEYGKVYDEDEVRSIAYAIGKKLKMRV